MKLIHKAACLGAAAALLTFLVLYFSEDVDYWRARLDGWMVTRCFQDPLAVVAMRAGFWALGAFVSVFSIAMLIWSVKR